MKKRSVYVGIDCSSVLMGVGIICSQTKELIEYFTIKLPSRTMFENIDTIENTINILISKYEIINIMIEDYLMGFGGGSTTQHTMMILCQINTLLEYVLIKKYNLNVHKINVQTARKKVFGKARKAGVDSKKFVLQEITKIYPEVEITYTRTGKNTAVGVNDYLDAIVLARAI